jgi:hypothetical protein
MSGPFTRVGKQILANGYHYADGADETAAQHIVERLGDRAAIVAWLLGGGDHDRHGVWHAWDSEMRSYAASFAGRIESGAHLPAPPIINSVEG